MSTKHVNNAQCPRCQELLSYCSAPLRAWFESEQRADHEMHISTGYRGKKEQNDAFRAKTSNAKFGESAHSYLPFMAIDVFYMMGGKGAWPMARYQSLASRAPADLQWGGVWKLVDGPHFEVKDWKKQVVNYPNGNDDSDPTFGPAF